MIQNITLNWPSVIEFGPGKIDRLREHLNGFSRIFFLTDPQLKNRIELIAKDIEKNGAAIKISDEVVPEPPIEALKKLLEPVHVFNPDAVVGIGGGSAMDLAKLVSVLFSKRQTPEEVIGIGKVSGRDVRLLTVSTTSGTGSEVTPIAVLTDLKQHLKKGVVSPFIVPDVAIVDPELTISLPPSITASTGMDAMTHCVEVYTNRHAHPIIDNIVFEGIGLIGKNLISAVQTGDNMEARTAMALGSLYGGLGLGPVNTAAVHALAYPLGGEYKISHGVSNSVLLPFVMNFNLPNCIEKYAKIGETLGISKNILKEERAKMAILKIREISLECKIPSGLKELNIPKTAIPSMAEAAMKVTRLLENNPRPVKFHDAEDIFKQAYEGTLN